MYIIAYTIISCNRRLPVYVGFEELHTPSAMRPTLCELFVSLILLFQTEWTGGIWSRIRKNSQVWNNFLVVGLFVARKKCYWEKMRRCCINYSAEFFDDTATKENSHTRLLLIICSISFFCPVAIGSKHTKFGNPPELDPNDNSFKAEF